MRKCSVMSAVFVHMVKQRTIVRDMQKNLLTEEKINEEGVMERKTKRGDRRMLFVSLLSHTYHEPATIRLSFNTLL